MKDQRDNATLEMLDMPKKRGRPVTGTAKSNSARQAAYRARKAAQSVTVTINRGLLDDLDAHLVCIRDGMSVQVLDAEAASALLRALRQATSVQLPPVDA
ncbi:hypothetical protein ACLH0B_21890 [Aeromonas salmonicida]|uniref:hypothetical protein n=1 Tax=Aeromonas salmonicida TaxID=645 RepID=UPI003CFE2DED